MPQPVKDSTPMSVPGPYLDAKKWQQAIQLGNQGWCAATHAALTALYSELAVRGHSTTLQRARVLNAQASFLRQAGQHAQALPVNAKALQLALSAPRYGGELPCGWGEAVDAEADARVGLAADYLGLGRLWQAQRVLNSAREISDLTELDTVPVAASTEPLQLSSAFSATNAQPWLAGSLRRRLRYQWVASELALALGQPDAAPLNWAALEQWRAIPSARHLLKTHLVATAVEFVRANGSGKPASVQEAAGYAAALGEKASELGLLPLGWAAYSLAEAAGESAAGNEKLQLAGVLDRRGISIVDVLGE